MVANTEGNTIYEEDFQGFPYGYRPGRSQHDALDALAFGVTQTKVNSIVDCDIQSFFDSINHEWLIRFAEHRIDVAGFELADDAECFLAELRERMERFGLRLHPDKTRLIEFGRFAVVNRQRRGLGKPETFNFLGFKHISGRTRNGGFQLKRKTRRDRMRAKLKVLKEELRRRMHLSAMLARLDGRPKEAIDSLEAFLREHSDDAESLTLASCLYADILWEADPENAEGRFAERFGGSESPRAANEAGRADVASAHIDRTRPKIEIGAEERDQLIFADALSETRQCIEAVGSRLRTLHNVMSF